MLEPLKVGPNCLHFFKLKTLSFENVSSNTEALFAKWKLDPPVRKIWSYISAYWHFLCYPPPHWKHRSQPSFNAITATVRTVWGDQEGPREWQTLLCTITFTWHLSVFGKGHRQCLCETRGHRRLDCVERSLLDRHWRLGYLSPWASQCGPSPDIPNK